MTLQEIETNLKEGIYATNPHGAAEAKGWLASQRSWVGGQLEEVIKLKPSTWQELRKVYKSAKDTDRAYEATEMGINEAVLRNSLKRMETLSSALSTLLRIAESEARNQF